MTTAAAPVAHIADARERARWLCLLVLGVLLCATMLAALAIGAAGIPVGRIVRALGSPSGDTFVRDYAILWGIRLPRVVLGALVGAALAVSGAVMQGLFRNPLADPGLVGVSAGASLAAALTIVLGGRFPLVAASVAPLPLVPLGAFLGGLCATVVLYAIATRGGRTTVAVLLLAGIALGALTGAATGLLVFIADDRQLRDLTFWLLGSLGGASWAKVASVAPFIVPVLVFVPLLSRGLNAFALGEANAFYTGVPVQRVKRLAILSVAVAVGAGVAVAGTIGFVGLVVPHVLRFLLGADHRFIMPASALLGASLLVGADLLARTLVSPAEMPVGILTALLGAPLFLWVLFNRATDL